jgi:UDP-glucose 4-epimerase
LNYVIGPRRPGDVIEVYADNTKANKQLGWTTQYTIEDMMSSAWQWEKTMQQLGW